MASCARLNPKTQRQLTALTRGEAVAITNMVGEMYAVIKTGGKQYKVAANDVIPVEKIDAPVGESVTLDQVLLLDDGSGAKVGAPLVEGAAVVAEVMEQKRGEKVIVFKKRRRHNYRRKNGHRQSLTVLRVTDILAADGKPKKIEIPVEAEATEQTEG